MVKILSKSVLFLVMAFCVMELLVRIFHLHRDTPKMTLDASGIRKFAPNQQGHMAYGGRKQAFTKYRINADGWNSAIEYKLEKTSELRVAIIGDSYIEGFHVDVENSIGRLIEKGTSSSTEVYEFGMSSADLASYVHLLSSESVMMNSCDFIFINIADSTDLYRMNFVGEKDYVTKYKNPLYNIYNMSMFLSYVNANLRILEPIKAKFESSKKKEVSLNLIENFNHILSKADLNKVVFILNSKKMPASVMTRMNNSNLPFIDYHDPFEASQEKLGFGFDIHWNFKAREIIAALITDFIKSKEVVHEQKN